MQHSGNNNSNNSNNNTRINIMHLKTINSIFCDLFNLAVIIVMADEHGFMFAHLNIVQIAVFVRLSAS